MNWLWIAAITILVFLEKVLPVNNWRARLGWFAGIGLIGSGCSGVGCWVKIFRSNEEIPPPFYKEGEQ